MEDQGRLVALALGKLARAGRSRRRPLDGVQRGDRARRASRASWSTAWWTSMPARIPASETCRSWPSSPSAPVIGQAPAQGHPGLRDRGRLRLGLRSRIRPRGFRRTRSWTTTRAMTYTSYDRSPAEVGRLRERAMPLDQRVRAAAVPLLVIFGEEDQLYDDPSAAAHAYGDVPGAQITMIPGPATRRTSRSPPRPPASSSSSRRRRAAEPLSTGYCQRPPPSPTRAGGPRSRIVGHAVLAAVADEQDMDLAELQAALRAGDRLLVDRRRARSSRRPPSAVPGSPREPRARGGRTPARRSPAGSYRRKPSSGVDAPARTRCRCRRPALRNMVRADGADQDSRARGRPDGPGAARAGAPGARPGRPRARDRAGPLRPLAREPAQDAERRLPGGRGGDARDRASA